MRISIGQITIIILLLFLLFGDFQSIKTKVVFLLKQINKFFQKKDRKKGT